MPGALLTTLFTIAVTVSANADDLCKDAALPITDSQRTYCRTETVHYRSGETPGSAVLAGVNAGTRCFHDDCKLVYRYFLKVPDGEIVDLGEFPPWKSITPPIYIWSGLGIQGNRIHTGTDDRSELYDKVIERAANTYCVIYRLTYPFFGEVRDCVGNYHKPPIDVGIVDEALHPNDAWRIACATHVGWTGKQCGAGQVVPVATTLRRTKIDTLYYLVVLGRYVRADGTRLSSDPGGRNPDYFIFRKINRVSVNFPSHRLELRGPGVS